MSASQASEVDTLPDLATWDYFPGGADGDFARLIPASAVARQAFNDLVRAVVADESILRHARRFIRFEETAPIPDDSSDTDSSTTAATEAPEQPLSYCGYYRFNMATMPNSMRLGWVLGSGRQDLPDSGVDFVLTAQRGQHRVRGRHCRISRDLHTGILFVHSDGRPVIIDGKDVLQKESPSHENGRHQQPVHEYQRALRERTGIMIGNLSYVIEFTNLPAAVQEFELEEARAAMGVKDAPSRLMSATPSIRTYEYFGYVVYPVTHGGVSSTVSLAYSKTTGLPMIIKKIKRTRHNYYAVATEIELLRTLNHANIYKLVEVIDHSGRTNGRDFAANEVDEVALVLDPPAVSMLAAIVSDWTSQIGMQSETEWLAEVMRQCSAGLEYMHGQGVMHRDIKPDNIGVVIIDPPKIVLIDLGSCEVKKDSLDHRRGTVRYLAPEVMAVKEKQSSEPFTSKVDMWALGLTLLEMLLQYRIIEEVGKDVYREWLAQKLDDVASKFVDFKQLACMLLERRWQDRASAVDVLEYLKQRTPGRPLSNSLDPLSASAFKKIAL